jgi:hypothetical protein
MAVSERTRKILWITAGGRCSICHVQLATEGTETDDPSVFGEEAHIVAQGQTGPRADGHVEDVDAYDNLILMCSKDHKRIDDQVGYYTVARLRGIKRSHEEWTRSLGDSTGAAARDEQRSRVEDIKRRYDRKFRIRVRDATTPKAATSPLLVTGEDSKVFELDLIRGAYRVNWRFDGTGHAAFNVRHESTQGGLGDMFIHGLFASSKPPSGELLLRIDESGRHLFSIKAPGLSWELAFSPI